MTIVLSLILVSNFLPIVGISFLRLPPLTLAGRRGKSWSCRPFFVPLTGVEVDHIVHLLSTSIYSPIMSVEWWFVSSISIAFRRRYPSHVFIRARGDSFVESPLKLTNFGPPHLPLDKIDWRNVHCPSSSFLPLKNLWPSSLIDGIMDRHNSLHINFLWIPVFPSHGIEKHLLRWVHPEFRIIWSIGCGYWAHYTIGLEGSCLSM